MLLSSEATPDMVADMNPDALIVATGAHALVPRIPGIDGPNVFHAVDTYWQSDSIGDRVAIIGGGLVGCETGLHLNALGKQVTIVEMMDHLAVDATESHRIALFRAMGKTIDVLTGAMCTAITGSGITVVDNQGRDKTFDADTIVYAVGMKSNTESAFGLCQAASKLYFMIGDCVSPRKVKQAVHEGYHAAMDIL